MHLINSLHEASHADIITCFSEILASIVDSIKLSNFVSETDPFKEDSDLLFRPWNLKVVFSNSHFSKS